MTLLAGVLIATAFTILINDLDALNENLQIERTDKQNLELKIEKKQTEVQTLEAQIEEIQADKEATQAEKDAEIENLKKELQAKREREANEARIAQQRQQVAAKTVTSGCEQYRPLLEKYSWNVDTMLHAMRLESGCNPHAVGDQYVIGGIYAPSCGLLQVRTLAGRPDCESLKNPTVNIATAYQIWQNQGYRAWSVLH